MQSAGLLLQSNLATKFPHESVALDPPPPNPRQGYAMAGACELSQMETLARRRLSCLS
jgi:hypothetical protein